VWRGELATVARAPARVGHRQCRRGGSWQGPDSLSRGPCTDAKRRHTPPSLRGERTQSPKTHPRLHCSVPDEGHQRPCRRYVAVPLATAPPRSRSGSRPCADKIVLVGRRHSGGLVGHYRPSVSALRVFIGFAALHCSPPVSFTFDSLQAKP